MPFIKSTECRFEVAGPDRSYCGMDITALIKPSGRGSIRRYCCDRHIAPYLRRLQTQYGINRLVVTFIVEASGEVSHPGNNVSGILRNGVVHRRRVA